MYALHVGNRDFGPGELPLPGGWVVEKMTWRAVGGPDEAVVSLRSSALTAWDWENMLRRPAVIRGPGTAPVWWGYVAEVDAWQDGIRARFSLDPVANTVRYRFTDLLGEHLDSCADLDSQERYGTKEIFIEMGATTSSRAGARAAGLLKGRETAAAGWETGALARTGPLVRLRLRGWWETLGWKHYADGGYAFAQGWPEWKQTIGLSIGTTSSTAMGCQVVQEKTPGFCDWSPTRLNFMPYRVGTPADFLQVSIYAVDAGNLPTGPALDTAVLARTLDTVPQVVSLSLNPQEGGSPPLGGSRSAVLAGGKPFALVFSRQGAVNSSSYFKLGGYEPVSAESAPFPYRTWTGTVWQARSPAAVLTLQVEGTVETTAAAAWMAAAAQGGQFIARVEVEDASGIWTAPNTDRAVRYRQEIEEMLRMGGSSSRRLLAAVSPERVLRVYPASNASRPACRVAPGGVVLTLQGRELSRPGEAAGCWALLGAAGAPVMWIERVIWEDGVVRVLS